MFAAHRNTVPGTPMDSILIFSPLVYPNIKTNTRGRPVPPSDCRLNAWRVRNRRDQEDVSLHKKALWSISEMERNGQPQAVIFLLIDRSESLSGHGVTEKICYTCTFGASSSWWLPLESILSVSRQRFTSKTRQFE